MWIEPVVVVYQNKIRSMQLLRILAAAIKDFMVEELLLGSQTWGKGNVSIPSP